MTRSAPKVLAPRKKPSIVLLHGLRGSPLGLETIATDLRAAGYEVYLPAVPPFAGAGDLAEYTSKAYTDYLAQYLREHHLQRPILIGHSMGSTIAAAFAVVHPEMLSDELILLSPISTKPNKFFALISPLAATLPCSVVDYATTRFLFVPHDQDLFQASLDLTHRCSQDHTPSHKAIAAATRFSTKHAVSDFNPQQKVLLIAGEKDRLIPAKKTRELAQRLQAKLEFIPNSGHLHNYEKPHETARLILDFLK